MAEEAIFNETLQVRLMHMEYSEVTEEDVRKMYIEETGEEPPFNITVYNSDDYVEAEEANGFDGTIIHVENEQGVNESYTITRGTQDFTEDDWHATDWTYNLMGIFAGQSDSQYRAAEEFDAEVTSEISKKAGSDPTKIGLGHSLGGNLITLLQLNTEGFEEVYTVNAAPPSFYQLIHIDKHFEEEVRKKFQINPENLDELYNVDPEKLQDFAEDYYEGKGENIYHLTAEQDFLTALFSIRGFFEVGETAQPVDAFPGEDVESLAELFDEIPDEFVGEVQTYFAKNYKDVYNEEGFEGFFQELTGLDPRLIDHAFNQGEDLSLWELVKSGVVSFYDAKKKVPELNQFLEDLSSDIPIVLDTLVKHGYITGKESATIQTEYENILENMQFIEKVLGRHAVPTGEDILLIVNAAQEIKESYDKIDENSKGLQEILGLAADAHSLKKVLQGLGAEIDFTYEKIGDNYDKIMTATLDGKEIKINISSAVRMFTEGQSVLDSKQEVLEEIKTLYEQKYINRYDNRSSRVKKEILKMEESPYMYQDLMGNFPRSSKVYHQVKKIDVHEEIPTNISESITNTYEHIFGYVEGVISKKRQLIEKMKESIESFFEEDERIANEIFNKER